MNKLSIPLSFIAIVISLSAFFYLSPKEELVYVDVNRLLNGYDRTAIEKQKFEIKTNKLKSDMDSLNVSWQQDLQAYEKDRISLSEKELEMKKEALTSKQQQVNNYQRAVQQQLQEEDKKMTQTVLNDINDFVKGYGEEHGYQLIFGATGSGNVMYAHGSSDLTEEVLEALNKDFEKRN
ncbi:outer membrane protein [Salegentibacter salinarum]|nr:OmpH family outer membrane protein [Salegentibacter salinarum]SKB98663.1 outer membrane protein [Salegentibacter salinarum]